MPDRLVELHGRIARKLAQTDAAIRAACARGDRTMTSAEGGKLLQRVCADWDELAALLAEEHEMLGEITRRTQELSSLSAFLQTHYEREKAALARELHDQLGGILTPARMDLAWLQSRLGEDPQYAERMSRLSTLIDQGIDLKRRIIENLRPSLLDHLGFGAAVQWYVDETCSAARLRSRVTISKLERLSPDLEIALYRVVQESVANIIRHAKAKNVEIIVERTGTGLRIAVSDDGVGIDDLESARTLSHGVSAMTQRMRAINGTLEIHSHKGEGTRVEAFLPIGA
jgi:signal transduction histidine kinase